MKTVVILGAGASRAEWRSNGGSASTRPPLDTDFFALAERHDLQNHIEVVGRFVYDHFGIQCFAHPRPRMEEVFSLVYTSTLGSTLPPGVRKAFASLCRIYTTVVANTTNEILPGRKGPLCRLLHECLNKGETTIITFNQDLLVEKALRVLANGSDSVQWYPDTGYSMEFGSYTLPSGTIGSGDLFPLSDSEEDSVPVVLKPHGSLNWYTATVKMNGVPARLSRGQKIKCTRRSRLSTDMTFTRDSDSGKGRRTWYTWPIIVPPVLEKGAFIGDALASVWKRALDSLRKAERIVVYGYSFPATDAQTRAFFMRAVTGMKERPLLVTVNPDLNAAVRGAEIFRPRLQVVSGSVREFLRG